MTLNCPICNKKNFTVVWNDKIRSGKNEFTKQKKIIYKCLNCHLVFLKNKIKKYENSKIARSQYNKSSSYKDFIDFHKNRELDKIKFLKRFISFDNKSILESNAGTGIIIEHLNKKPKSTAALDNIFYKNYYKNKNHSFFSNISEIKKSNKKFDIILSLTELEHKYEPKKFLKDISSLLLKKGILVLRVPNYDNIYSHLIGKPFYKYDYRTSHNYYFSKKNLRLLFEKINLNIINELGYNEYSINHLIEYMKTKKEFIRKN